MLAKSGLSGHRCFSFVKIMLLLNILRFSCIFTVQVKTKEAESYRRKVNKTKLVLIVTFYC